MPEPDKHEESKSAAVQRSLSDHVHSYGRGLPALSLRLTLTPTWLPAPLRNPFIGYTAAVVVSAVTILLTARLVMMVSGFAYAGGLCLLGTLIVALGWGIGPSALSALLSSFLLNFYVLSPGFAWNFDSRRDIVSFLVFLAVGIVVSLLIGDLAYHHQEARRTQARLAAALASEQRALAAAEAEMQAQVLARQRLDELARQLAAERDRLQQVLDVLPVAVLIADTDGSVVMANQGAQEILGFQMLGRRLSAVDTETAPMVDARRLDGTPYPMAELPLARAALHGETSLGEQVVFHNRVTGKQIPVLGVGAPLYDAGGTRIGGMVVFQDISSIKELERQRDEFLASVSHDLKNPLTAILAMTSLLKRYVVRLPEPDQDRVFQSLARIGQIADRMTGQINELLDLTWVQMGKPLELQRAPVDLVGLLGGLVAEYQQGSDRHSIRFVPDVPWLLGHYDPARLERGLVNVLVNAIKYSPKGGEILVTLHAMDHTEAGWVTIRISDHGVGIPAGELSRVFDRFYRASNIAGQVTGTGLGLSGVRHVIEQHGGSVDIESTEGAGTTVTIRLPIDRLQMNPDGSDDAG